MSPSLSRRVAVSTVLAGLIFAVDLSLPLGVAGGVPYVALVLTGLWYPDKRALPVLGLVGTVLTLAGYFLSDPGGVPWMVFTNRALALAAIWITAVLCFQRQERDQEEGEAKSNARLRGAVDTLQEAFAYFDAADRLVMCNDEFRRLHPASDNMLQPGNRFEDIVRSVVEAGEVAEAIGREEEFIRQRIEQHRNPQGPFLRERANGTWYMISEGRTPDGGICETMMDVTELKAIETKLRESEALFRAIIDNSPAKIHIKDADGRYTLINPEAEKLFGITDAESRGRTSHDLFPEKAAGGFMDHDRAVVESGKAIEQEEEWQLEDGIHTFLTVKFPIFNPDGVVAVGAIGTDITKRKRAEEALHKAHEELELNIHERTTQLREEIEDRKRLETSLLEALEKLEQASHAKSEFLAHMSHELRTPLNAIIGFSDIMQSQSFGPVGNSKYLEYAGDINQSGKHLLDLINDILDLSKIEARKMVLHIEDVDLAGLYDECIRLMRPLAESRKVVLKLKESGRRPTLQADHRGIKQVLLNLLSNAIKFSPQGGEVSLESAVDTQGALTIKVIDTGIGMDEEGIAVALTPFGQAHSDIASEVEGTGLGLPLAKGLVEAHGGDLIIESQKNVGTTLIVRFPPERVAVNSVADKVLS